MREGTQRWIVHFKTRGFDLEPLRKAILQRRSAADIEPIIDDLQDQMKRDQAEFVREVERQGADVVTQWWLVNACCIEVEPAHLPRIRGMANVDFLQPDHAVQPHIRKATDAKNHNADWVHNNLKIDGAGVAVGVIDSGHDQDMGGSGRPHRAYYRNGNPKDTTGSGIKGSRLVINRKIGSVSADDVSGHGTAVATIAAGGNWGTAGADHGHAFGADVAGYAIAVSKSGGSQISTMTSAWQALVSDRARYSIVTANLSYAGSPSPLSVEQKALDSAAYNGDIMICVSAGNNGALGPINATSGSQGAANGLAVAAVSPDQHQVASFSSMGPLVSGRLYPDVAGCGVGTAAAARDNEATNYVNSGTSFASPQVTGAATLVRAADRKLSALETKAILLASTQSVATSNPGMGRNNYGMGLVRDDIAVRVARASGGRGIDQVTLANRTVNIRLNVAKDKFYTVAIAWHRWNLAVAKWSNLDIAVLEGSVAIAESKSKQNLYEVTRFIARKTGTVVLQVTSPTLDSGAQRFAYAMAETPKARLPGVVVTYGAGCKGNGSAGGVRCQSDNTASPLYGSIGFTGLTYLMEVKAASNLTVDGFEMKSNSRQLQPLTIGTVLYTANAKGEPDKVVSSGSMTVGTSEEWYKTAFNNRVSFNRGQIYFLGFTNPPSQSVQLPITQSGNVTPHWRNGGPGSTNGSWVRSTVRPWAYITSCVTPPGANPQLRSVTEPEIGKTFELALEFALPKATAILLTGVSNTSWNSTPLPLDLTGFGAPGCRVFAAGDVLTYHQVDGSGSMRLKLPVPATPALVGHSVYQQAAVVDPQANTFGFALSNALRVTVGGTP